MNYGCIGEKLGHSFSKEIHNELFDYDYELKEIPKEQLDLFLKNKDFHAINVTIPYKEKVIPYLDYISDIAKEIGAVNTVVNKNGKLYGYNTDFLGLTLLIKKNNILFENKKVLVLGSGGTSKTALAVAKSLNASEIYRVSRNKSEGCITYNEALKLHNDAQIIINTTPCGMYPNIGESAVKLSLFNNLEGVVDAVYNPLRSKLVCDAKKLGINAIGGLFMLVAQAAFAAEKFIDTAVDFNKVDMIYDGLYKSKQNIVLVGMPASGKTTVGKLLAEKLNLRFVDTDEEIVKLHGEITSIFEKYGESVFRDLEAAVVKEVSALQGTVIATGGGVVLREQNVDLLKENGRIYFLDRPLESIVPTADRPLSSDRAALKKRYNERYPIYCKCADKHIISNSTPEDTVADIMEDFYK